MITINIDIKEYDDFAMKFWRIILDEAINTWIKKSVYKLQDKVQEEQVSQKVYDTWLLANSYQTEFSNLYGKLENSRLYWLFQHEWFRFRNWRLHKWRPWFIDAVKKNQDLPAKVISEEIQNTIKKFVW